MERKKLLSLPVAPPPDIGVKPEVREEVGCAYGSYTRRIAQYLYTIRPIENPEPMLETTVYRAGGEWIFRVWQTGSDLCAQNADSLQKPSKSTLANRYPDACNYRFFGDEGSQRAAEAWTGYEGDALELVRESQQKILDKRRIAAHAAYQRRVDEWCGDVPELPDTLAEWINDHVLHHLLLYSYSRKSTTSGYCTHCRQNVSGVRGARHHQKGICPSCGHPVEYIAQGRFASGAVETVTVAVLGRPQNASHGTYCLRSACVAHSVPCIGKSLTAGYTASLTVADNQRIFLSERFGPLKAFQYEPSFYKEDERGTMRWSDSGQRDAYARLYTENLPVLLQGTALQYIPFEPLAECLGAHEVGRVLRYCMAHPGVEHLLKHGLTRLAADIVYDRYAASSGGVRMVKADSSGVREMLGVTRPELPVLRSINPSLPELRTYHVLRPRGYALPEIFGRLRGLDISCASEVVRQVMRFAELPEALDYVENEAKQYPARTCRELFADYSDYLQEAESLGFDLRRRENLFPQNLRERHIETATRVRAMKDARSIRMRAREFDKARRRAETLCWEDKKLGIFVRPVSDEQELIAEGKALHHCVATYAARIAEGKSVIMLVRRKAEPERPYFTCELDPESREIRQCRTLQNRSYTTELVVEQFLQKWMKALKKAE